MTARLTRAQLHIEAASPDAFHIAQADIDEAMQTASDLQHPNLIALAGLRQTQLQLAQGDAQQALESSTRAVTLLHQHPRMVILREEELLLAHALALETAGHPDARRYFAAAADELTRKAQSLRRADRQRFLERVPVNRRIATASSNVRASGP